MARFRRTQPSGSEETPDGENAAGGFPSENIPQTRISSRTSSWICEEPSKRSAQVRLAAAACAKARTPPSSRCALSRYAAFARGTAPSRPTAPAGAPLVHDLRRVHDADEPYLRLLPEENRRLRASARRGGSGTRGRACRRFRLRRIRADGPQPPPMRYHKRR